MRMSYGCRGAFAACLLLIGCTPDSTRSGGTLADGYRALQNQQFDVALASADAALARGPAAPVAAEALYLRGRALEQRVKRDEAQLAQDLQRARSDYARALELTASEKLRSLLLAGIANVAYAQQDYAAAERNWKAASAGLAAEDQIWALYRIGLCQQRLGRFVDADATFAAVEAKYPNTEPARRAREHRGARGFYVQVATFASPDSAGALSQRLTRQGLPVKLVTKPDQKHVVLVGPHQTYASAVQLRSGLLGQYPDARVVP